MGFATVADRYSPDDIARFYESGQWKPDTLFEMLQAQVAAQPDRVFITDDHQALTFTEMRDQAIAFAAGLHARGIAAGDRVAVQMPNWVEFGAIAAGLSRLGAIMVPIMPIYRRDEVSFIGANADIKAAVIAPEFRKFDYAQMYAELHGEIPSRRDIILLRTEPGAHDGSFTRYDDVLADGAGASADDLGPGVGPDDPIVIVFSSGTTARPKGCLHTFNTLACGSRMLAKGWDYSPQDVQFGPSPVTHMTGLVTSIILPMMHGAPTHIMEQWIPELAVGQIKDHSCSVAVTATTFLQTLLDAYDPDVHDLSSLRVWTCAGSPIPAAIVERAKQALPQLTVLSLYGRTENVTTTMCTVRDPYERSLTSDGAPLPLQSVKIVDDDGVEVPRGEEGDIAYRGAMHMLEYIHNPQETAKLFTSEGYSRSGDLGRMDENGFVRVTGRTKDIVIRGGMNISVRQVEDLLSHHPAIRDAAAVAMPDERLGEKVCLYAVPAPGHEDVTLAEISDYLLGHAVAIQKVPERLELIGALPMTASGKVQKHVLRSMIADKLAQEAAAR
ncbi:MAG: AMP-binding protein [Tetrasphaera sp.]